MSPRQMHLVAFMVAGPTCHHHGSWRHAESDADEIMDPARYEHLARVLEAGRFDALFFADILGLYDYYEGTYAKMVEAGGQMGLLDPMLLLAAMARVTRHIGLAATLSTTCYHPYHLARSLATLDHMSGGRAAWNVVTSATQIEARNFGLDGLPPRAERYDRADEVLEACTGLWDSWGEDALVVDRARGLFADPAKVRSVDYEGRWVRTKGPLTTPRSPQGRPVVMQAGSSGRGREFAARWAEVLFTMQHAKDDMRAFYDDMHARLDAAGRRPEECAILPAIDVVIGETESIARERAEHLNALVDPVLGLAEMSAHMGKDLSPYPLDQPLASLDLEEGSRGVVDIVMQSTKARGLTLAQAGHHYGISQLTPQIVGTPATIADHFQDLFESRACDGFVLTPALSPGMFAQFAKSVVPELQRRGIFRREYAGRTFRENLRA